MTTWAIARESTEWVGPVTITADDEPVTAFELALVSAYGGARPTDGDWRAPYVLDGEPGYLVSGLNRGDYSLWARVAANPETIVVRVGLVSIT